MSANCRLLENDETATSWWLQGRGRTWSSYQLVIADAKDEDHAVRDLSEERLIWLIASHKVAG